MKMAFCGKRTSFPACFAYKPIHGEKKTEKEKVVCGVNAYQSLLHPGPSCGSSWGHAVLPKFDITVYVLPWADVSSNVAREISQANPKLRFLHNHKHGTESMKLWPSSGAHGSLESRVASI